MFHILKKSEKSISLILTRLKNQGKITFLGREKILWFL